MVKNKNSHFLLNSINIKLTRKIGARSSKEIAKGKPNKKMSLNPLKYEEDGLRRNILTKRRCNATSATNSGIFLKNVGQERERRVRAMKKKLRLHKKPLIVIVSL